jgi:hypothetical protein
MLYCSPDAFTYTLSCKTIRFPFAVLIKFIFNMPCFFGKLFTNEVLTLIIATQKKQI